jgi:hypothetical protein
MTIVDDQTWSFSDTTGGGTDVHSVNVWKGNAV